MMKKLFCYLIIGMWGILFSLGSLADSNKRDSLNLKLNDCLRLALEKNKKIQGKIYGVEAAKWQEIEATGLFAPQIEYEYQGAIVPADVSDAFDSYFSADWSFFNRAKVSIGVPLYTFGKLKTAEALAGKGVEQSIQEKYKEDAQVASEVKQLYYAMLLGKEVDRLLSKATEELKERVAKEEKNNEHSPYEVMQMKIFVLELEERLEEVTDKTEMAKEGMRIQLGMSSDQKFILNDDKLKPVVVELGPLQEYIDTSMSFRPESQLLEVGVEAKNLQRQLEKKQLFPNLGIGGFFELGRTTSDIRGVSLNQYDPFNFTRGGFGLELKGKLDYYRSHARIEKLTSEYNKALLESSIAREALKLDIREAYLNAKRMQNNLVRSEEKQKLARRMMFLARSNYDLGVGREKEYVESLKLLLGSRGEYFKAIFDFNKSLAQLDEKIGVVPQ